MVRARLTAEGSANTIHDALGKAQRHSGWVEMSAPAWGHFRRFLVRRVSCIARVGAFGRRRVMRAPARAQGGGVYGPRISTFAFLRASRLPVGTEPAVFTPTRPAFLE